MIARRLKVFSTCVQSTDVEPRRFTDRVAEVSRWSEEIGCEGMLIYSDNRLVDPWLVAQVVLQATKRLCPLVAVQPFYKHPYTVANLAASLGLMYGRRIILNMVAGGFRNDLLALNDPTPHDKRYDRMVEYTSIVVELLARSTEGRALTYEGKYYTVKNLRLTPALPAELRPGIFVSGSSDAGLAAARELGATAVQYPTPPEEFPALELATDLAYGIRVGIIARPDAEEAWSLAESRFPTDRTGKLTRQLAARVSDSKWHQTLSDQARQASGSRATYWLVPFEHYKTMCPYLVGDYDQVAELARTYIRKGYQTFILDIPPSREELRHTAEVFRRCAQ